MKNIFESKTTSEIIERINKLSSTTNSNWGRMNVAQMLAHCNVTYDMVYTDKYPKPNAFKKFLLTALIKKDVVGEKAYTKNGRTAPQFLVTDQREFEVEKQLLIGNIEKTQTLGENHFQNKESHSMGELAKNEWSNMFYKHLDHHLGQFGV